MLQRGRKSSEGLSVVRVAPHERAAPPDRLGGEESTIWREIVASKPADWFGVIGRGFLAQIHVVSAGEVVGAANDGDGELGV